MSITEFFRTHKPKLNIAEFERRTNIKGQLLSQVIRGVDFRSINKDQEDALKEQLEPLYKSLKEVFE